MRKVSEKDYKKYIMWAKANTANKVYPCSIAEGFQSGDIYVNDGTDVEAVFFWHYCGFGYISGNPSGNPSDELMNDIYSEMISGHSGKRLVLITSDDVVALAEEALQNEGIQKIFGLVFKDNDAANTFWEQQGYSLRTNLNYRNKSLNKKIPAGE